MTSDGGVIGEANFSLRSRAPRRRSEGPSARQLAKSETMRLRVLEATVDCLLEGTAHELSFAVIADRAGISRGGAQYHFATRRDLLCAVIEYINVRRLNQFKADVEAIGPDEDVASQIIDAHWRHLNERDFRAYQELVLLARSDAELTEAFAPRYQAFLRDWYETARQAFGWRYADPQVMQAGNIAHYVLEGMAYGQLAGQVQPEVVADLLGYAKTVLRNALQD
ncbi:TetR family transcriptional regulator [Novosphingobium olei]|uniref:TetR/AcrR family transcriptional regulator n=1 Tax=Novosphingobium olei TaxID=2728851 RepID=A0A7Y0GAX8_9SPHN|nr:TetR/AcrR family transcriptional regulator [Novosphingobium olei]